MMTHTYRLTIFFQIYYIFKDSLLAVLHHDVSMHKCCSYTKFYLGLDLCIKVLDIIFDIVLILKF
jgi:hypothetical protein